MKKQSACRPNGPWNVGSCALVCCVYSPSPTSPPTHVVTAHSGDCRAVLTSELRPPEGTVGGSKAVENLSQVEDGWEVGGKRKR